MEDKIEHLNSALQLLGHQAYYTPSTEVHACLWCDMRAWFCSETQVLWSDTFGGYSDRIVPRCPSGN